MNRTALGIAALHFFECTAGAQCAPFVEPPFDRQSGVVHHFGDGLAPPLDGCIDDQHEPRGHPGIFVTGGSAVPTSLCVNPSLTIAALAERASALLLRRAGQYGLDIRSHVPLPGRTEAARQKRCVHPV